MVVYIAKINGSSSDFFQFKSTKLEIETTKNSNVRNIKEKKHKLVMEFDTHNYNIDDLINEIFEWDYLNVNSNYYTMKITESKIDIINNKVLIRSNIYPTEKNIDIERNIKISKSLWF